MTGHYNFALKKQKNVAKQDILFKIKCMRPKNEKIYHLTLPYRDRDQSHERSILIELLSVCVFFSPFIREVERIRCAVYTNI